MVIPTPRPKIMVGYPTAPTCPDNDAPCEHGGQWLMDLRLHRIIRVPCEACRFPSSNPKPGD